MSGNQTVYVGQDLRVIVNVIGDSGSHVAATINDGTTRVDGFAAIPTINTIGTGIYEIVFAGLTPAPVESDVLIVKVNGSIDGGSAWSEYAIPVIVLDPMRGTNDGSTFDHTADQVITDTASREASKADVSGLSTFDPTTDEVTTDTASREASKADVAALATATELAKVIKSGEQANYVSDLGSKAVTATRV